MRSEASAAGLVKIEGQYDFGCCTKQQKIYGIQTETYNLHSPSTFCAHSTSSYVQERRMGRLTDADLVRRSVDGDTAAFIELIDVYNGMMV